MSCEIIFFFGDRSRYTSLFVKNKIVLRHFYKYIDIISNKQSSNHGTYAFWR